MKQLKTTQLNNIKVGEYLWDVSKSKSQPNEMQSERLSQQKKKPKFVCVVENSDAHFHYNTLESEIGRNDLQKFIIGPKKIKVFDGEKVTTRN